MAKFRWCFIGAGDLAKTVANQLNKSGRHEVVSVYTRNYEKGQAFAEKHAAKAYPTAEEAITAQGVDGVYIVLSVAVDTDGNVGLCFGFHKTAEQGVLVSHIAAKRNTAVVLVLFSQFFYYVEGFILRAVVYKENATVIANFLCGDKVANFSEKGWRRFG